MASSETRSGVSATSAVLAAPESLILILSCGALIAPTSPCRTSVAMMEAWLCTHGKMAAATVVELDDLACESDELFFAKGSTLARARVKRR